MSPSFYRRTLLEGESWRGMVRTESALVMTSRVRREPAGAFESWEAVLYSDAPGDSGEAQAGLLALGRAVSTRPGADELVFAMAEVVSRSGKSAFAQMGCLDSGAAGGSFAGADGIQVECGKPHRSEPVAFAARRDRFSLGSFSGGSGSAVFGLWGTAGRMVSGGNEFRWEGKFENPSDEQCWDLLVPQFPVVPRRWICFASASSPLGFTGEFPSATDPRAALEATSAPALLTRRWGSAHPVAWARVVGSFEAADLLADDLTCPPSFVSGAWVKMGRLGVLGPPLPKTFFTFRFSETMAARLGLSRRVARFGSVPRALLCSSYVVFPRWEARLPGRELAATVCVDVSGDEPFQYEWPDPEEAGVFVAKFPFPRIEIVLEAKRAGRWRHAATLFPRHSFVEFGGREALPYLPLLPKEFALGRAE